MVTPGGYLDIELADATGIFSYDSTFFGAGNMRPGKAIRVMFQHETSTFYMFSGIIESITPHPASHTATIYAVDGFERLNNTVISAPSSTAASSGGLTPTAGFLGTRPVGTTDGGVLIGGALAALLDAAGGFSASTGMRNLSEIGSTLTVWGVLNENALSAIHALEEHERRGRCFINGAGVFTFHSSTHRNGSTSQYSVTSADFQDFAYTVDIKSVTNAVTVSYIDRRQDTASAIVGKIPVVQVPQLPAGAGAGAANGSTMFVFVPFTSDFIQLPLVPLGSGPTTGDFAENSSRDLGGTTHGGETTITGTVIAGKGMRIKLVSNSCEAIWITHPNAGSTLDTLYISGYPTGATNLTSTASNDTSIADYLRREKEVSLPYLGTQADAALVATDVISSTYLDPRPTGVKLYIAATDTETRRQILTRELGDKITVTAAELGITSKVYEIIGVEYSLTPDKGNDTVCFGFLNCIWNLDTAS